MPRKIRRPLTTTREKVVYRDRPVEVVKEVEVEKVVYRDHPAAAMLDEMEEAKAKLDERPADPLEVSEEPPEEIADLFNADLTARQNQESLQKKYAEAMSMREIHLSHGETSQAMECLRKAERYDSGIKWNRARLAEVI